MKHTFKAGEYDVIVIGAGHAGCEAALAAARMGCRTAVFSISIEGIALMPCNPAVGGPGKGHLVREVDALGGEIGRNIDKTYIQIRRLNTGKGPAVRALRAQADKKRYQEEMIFTLQQQENLDVKQGMIERILVNGDRVSGVITNTGAIYKCQVVVVTTGTYLKGKVMIGEVAYDSGPHGLFPSRGLSESLVELGIGLRRFSTCTPPRIDRRSVDFHKLIEQTGDPGGLRFSFISDKIERDQVSCWLAFTNEKAHEIISNNLHRAPLVSGVIKGAGPRYCPSIEDKIVRFKEKPAHQLFIEPEGLKTNEMYVNGMPTSLPEDVQLEVLRSVEGLEKVEIIRPGYAIEYDHIKGEELKNTLETKKIKGLFSAGQVNGSSGYEEAAAQGLLAGINAALLVKNREPLELKRSDAYIGVLVDDLITKENWEPYRIMTARAEYRLLLREDNADLRLTEIGRKIGLVSDERLRKFDQKLKDIEAERKWLKETIVSSKNKKIVEWLNAIGSSVLKNNINLWELLKRPEIKLRDLERIFEREGMVTDEVLEEVEIEVKYEGYIRKQIEQVERFLKLERKKIPADFNYEKVVGLSSEGKEKLIQRRPETLGQAGRIAGISPADLSILLVYLEQRKRGRFKEDVQ